MPLASINQDQGQLWFAQQIKAGYGVTNVFADAWSAPPFMKTIGAVRLGVPGDLLVAGPPENSDWFGVMRFHDVELITLNPEAGAWPGRLFRPACLGPEISTRQGAL